MRDVTVSVPKMHAGQRRVDQSFMKKRFVVVMCGRRWGKTKYGVRRAVRRVLAGGSVGWFAPTHKYALEAWREVVGRLRPAARRVSEQEKRVEVGASGSFEVWSLETPDAGRSRAYDEVVVDEAGLVRDLEGSWEGSLRQTLTDRRGSALFLGTPKGASGYFVRLFRRGESGERFWSAHRAPTLENPYIPADEVEAARRELPPEVFAQEYEGVPSEDGGNPFGLAAIAGCVGVGAAGRVVVWGWDFARAQDYTVGVGLDAEWRVAAFERFQKPWGETKQRVMRATGGELAWGDSTGVGDPIIEDLQGMGLSVQRVTFTGSSLHTAGTKQRLMERLAQAIQQGQVRFPDGVLRSELESFEYHYGRTGVRYEAPRGLHDDCVMALALAVHGRDQMGLLEPARLALARDMDAGGVLVKGEVGRKKLWMDEFEPERPPRWRLVAGPLDQMEEASGL